MKRLLLLLYFIFINYSFGQNFKSGLTMGLNTSQVSGDNLSGFNKIGLRSGGFISIKTASFITQLELQYINKGSRELINQDTFSEGYKFQLKYAEMPISLKKKASNNILCEFGVSIGYLLDSSETINGHEETSLNVNKLEYSFHVGFDYFISKNLAINTRVSNSLGPIRPHSSGQTYRWNRGQYNTSISFVLYYHLNNT